MNKLDRSDIMSIACEKASESLSNELKIKTDDLFDSEGTLKEQYQDRFNKHYDWTEGCIVETTS